MAFGVAAADVMASASSRSAASARCISYRSPLQPRTTPQRREGGCGASPLPAPHGAGHAALRTETGDTTPIHLHSGLSERARVPARRARRLSPPRQEHCSRARSKKTVSQLALSSERALPQQLLD